VFPVFHPAAALYTPANRQVLEADFAKLRPLLERGLAAMNPGTAGAAVLEAPVEISAGGSRPPLQRTEQLPLW